MTTPTDRPPNLTVWDLPRSTIREFAEAIAADHNSVTAERVAREILNAIWRGTFETSNKCFVSLPEADDTASWVDGRGTVWRDADGEEIPKPYPAFTRENLRDAALEISNPAKANEMGFTTYEALIDRDPASFGFIFGVVYARLLIDTVAVLDWLSPPKRGPGRPNDAKQIIIDEANRRLDAGQRPTSAKAFAEVLRKWISESPHCKGTIRPLGLPSAGTIENYVRPILRQRGLISRN